MESIPFDLFYADEFGRVLATVVRLIGDLHFAEEAVQDAFAVALTEWPRTGWPANPRAWLVSTARHKAIDAIRRVGRLAEIREQLRPLEASATADDPIAGPDEAIPDERLRLIFTCCHPALAPEAQVALSLRTLCGLSTDEIARAFLVAPATMAQRLVRAKQKIREARIPYEVPARDVFSDRLDAVMAVVYLVFNEGYAASTGETLVRADLCREAIRLARFLAALLPSESESRALLALMLLHDARRATRTTPAGEIVLLEEQDRSAWDAGQIAEGLALAESAARSRDAGQYAVQASIAAEHARAARPGDTDWGRIAALYDRLLALRPSPVVELNRAVAIAMRDGPEAGLGLLEALRVRGDLDGYHLLWSAEADLLRRLGRRGEAAEAYRRALALVSTGPERRFLERRLSEVERAG